MLQNIEITTTPADADVQAGGCCGGGCCAVPEQSTTDVAAQTFEVEGMTCGHCVSSVTEEISGLAGVEGVQVELVVGGRSKVTVNADAPLRLDDVRAAVSDAGYSLV
ncbi:heavy-metal-associated domain-containing protein [Agrococcus beijingensis]|uniref:heavy-metal-associated domain-containing protein n=1 Tax=Agrococcus beijingensis TaxID=3068634 RepID=UPI002741AA70|nr:heavy metal-associated domain-containing protein [Agrococcus sp. REN33]